MYRILDILKKSEGYLSGEDIGKMLDISRAAVWKGIQKLRKEGYEIEAVTNKGYRLTSYESLYNQRELEDGLKTKKLGHPLFFYSETDTTNDRIRELAQQGTEEGALAVADLQTAGRGRRGRSWDGPAGGGIWMSLLLRPQLAPAKASVLTLLAGLAIRRAIEDVTGLSPVIKWPNDVMLGGKKLSGILTEMDCEMDAIHFVTVGMGINVNMTEFPPELKDIATSLYLEGGRSYSRRKLLHRVLEVFEEYYEILEKEGGFAPFREEYRKHCMNLGRTVRVLGREEYLAEALDITPEGELVVRRLDTGREEVVFSGEVSVRGEEH